MARGKQDPLTVVQKYLPPMLATLAADAPADAARDWLFELKYDGFRALYCRTSGGSVLRSRNDQDLGARFPTVLRALDRIAGDDFIIDGEIVALDDKGVPRFQLLQQGGGGRLVFVAFDLLRIDGRDTATEPIEDRRDMLESLLRKPPAGVTLSELIDADVGDALKAAASAGYEGLVGKKRRSSWSTRRSKEWIKLKAQGRQEFAIVGYTPSTRSTAEIGALLLAVAEGDTYRFAGKVGTGYTAKMRTDLMKRLRDSRLDKPPVIDPPRVKDATWVEPELVGEVSFTEWTSDGRLRHPSFLGLRTDKSPRETAREKATQPPAGKGKNSGSRKKPPAAAASKVAASSRSAAIPAKQKGKKKSVVAPEVRLTTPDRLLYPRDGITKADVARYYEELSVPIIRALADRPLALEHWNSGIDKGSWFHQNVEEDAEPWMTTIETPTRTSKRTITHLVADRPETLRWLAQRSVLTMHMWSSRGSDLEKPDWMVFDLDPAKGKGIEQAVEVALVLRRLFEDLEIPSIPKTSGKRGIHVFVPLERGPSHEQAAAFAIRLADAIASRLPNATTERAIAKRRGRLYLDALQNGYGKTVVAPYSLRALDGAPVSAPLRWSEVTRRLDPLKYNLRTMPGRLQKVGDLFETELGKGIRLENWSFE